jgi:adenylosuccinate synthase
VKHVNKQLPTFSVAMTLLTNRGFYAYLSAGAVINIPYLFEEARKYPKVHILVHPNAAVISDEDLAEERQGSISHAAGTRSGTGAALARKIKRDPEAIWGKWEYMEDIPHNIQTLHHRLKPEDRPYIMEVAQGFSLGINQPFYPKVTSRECTVMQGLADAGLPPDSLKRVYMCIRTYPIRVGNVDGISSGEWYKDQEELTWEEIGVQPELTTVTQRVRRVATFSWEQFEAALRANHPDFVFINFLNYLEPEMQKEFLSALKANRPFGIPPYRIIEGRGADASNIKAPPDQIAY